jgi:hypothetical protein
VTFNHTTTSFYNKYITFTLLTTLTMPEIAPEASDPMDPRIDRSNSISSMSETISFATEIERGPERPGPEISLDLAKDLHNIPASDTQARDWAAEHPNPEPRRKRWVCHWERFLTCLVLHAGGLGAFAIISFIPVVAAGIAGWVYGPVSWDG